MINAISTELRSQLEKKRLIFTVTTGRSGTAYLTRLLGCVSGIVSYHEPQPEFSGVMRSVQESPSEAYRFWISRKLPQIAREHGSVYAETSHSFCKGFAEPLLELGIIPDLIILRRPHRQVARSMYELDTIPGRTEFGLRYYLDPSDHGVLSLPQWQQFHDYQLCYWYCLEIERRSEIYKTIFAERGARVVETSIDLCATLPGLSLLLRGLALPDLGFLGLLRYQLLRKWRVNAKTHERQRLGLPPDVDLLEKEVLDAVDRATALPTPASSKPGGTARRSSDAVRKRPEG